MYFWSACSSSLKTDLIYTVLLASLIKSEVWLVSVAALRGGAGGGPPGRSVYRGRRTDLNKKIINAFIKENVRFMNVFDKKILIKY